MATNQKIGMAIQISAEVSVCAKCGNEIHIGDWPICPHGQGCFSSPLSSIHPSERAVVFRNPRTGEVRYPPRNDSPLHPKYAAQGYVREELSSMAQLRSFEKETGRVHERSHCDPGSATAEKSLLTNI